MIKALLIAVIVLVVVAAGLGFALSLALVDVAHHRRRTKYLEWRAEHWHEDRNRYRDALEAIRVRQEGPGHD